MREMPPADYPGCPVTVPAAIEEGQTLRVPRWGLWDVPVMLIAAAVFTVIAGVLLAAVNAPFGISLIIGGSAGWLGLAGWPLLVTKLRGNGPRIDLGLRLTWSDVRWGVGAGICALVVGTIVSGITIAIFGDFNSAAGEAAQEIVDEGSRPLLIAFGFMILVGAPIAEEVAFRGLLFAGLRKRGFGSVITVLISATAFALFHFEPVRFAVLLSIGLVLGLTRAKTGSLGASIIAHGVNNAPGALFLIFGLPGMTP